jgi:hypothetical protein
MAAITLSPTALSSTLGISSLGLVEFRHRLVAVSSSAPLPKAGINCDTGAEKAVDGSTMRAHSQATRTPYSRNERFWIDKHRSLMAKLAYMAALNSSFRIV